MSLAQGRHYLAIPGPSAMPDRVLQAMHRPAPNIYTGELVDLVSSVIPDLKAVARTKHNVAIYIGNGHAAWEASLANVVSEGDTVLVLATGRFGIGWGDMASKLGATVELLSFGNATDIDLARVAEALTADTAHRIKAVMAVQVDTSTSVRNDIPGLRKVMDEAAHPALLMVDCIACLGCDVFEMDAWGVDVMVAGSQKGLMTPPGLGFVFFNDKAEAVRSKMPRVSGYWDWMPRGHPTEFYQHFCGTAPTHHLFGLRTALDMLVHEEGVEVAWTRHGALARAVWAAFDTWSANGTVKGGLALNIADATKRSHAVTSASAPVPYGTALRDWMTSNVGVTLGIGLGMATRDDPNWDRYFRIGHMGHVNAHMVLGVLGGIEAGLQSLGIPYVKGGVSAAAEAVGAHIGPR